MDLCEMEMSPASSLTTIQPSRVNILRLKFTTLSDGMERSNFTVSTEGARIGRSTEENGVAVPSDATLLRAGHARIAFIDGQFNLIDNSESCE